MLSICFHMIRFQAGVTPVARTCVNHRLSPNEGSYIYFFHIYLIHVGSSEFLKIHFNPDFFFICHIKTSLFGLYYI